MKRLVMAAVAMAMMAWSGSAMAQSFTAGNAVVTGLGDEILSGFDTFNITGQSGSWPDSSPQTIANLVFNQGPNCTSCTLTPSGLLGFSLTVGSVTDTAYVGWAWSSVGCCDTLALTAPADMTFVQPDGEVDTVVFKPLAPLAPGNGATATGTLDASVQVPEPVSMVLLGTGMLGLGIVRRRRR